MNKTKKTKKPTSAAKRKLRPKAIYYLIAGLRCMGREAKANAKLESSIEVWVKAGRIDAAIAMARRRLAAEGWQLKKIQVASKVCAGFARIGSMIDPPIYSEKEADEWTDQYRIAEAKGFACSVAHY
ncbi:MAG: hypothetical protein WCI73_00985 [Phycisphaerae bacterium]